MKYIRLLIPVERLYEKLENPCNFKTTASLIIYSTYDFLQKIMKMKRFEPILNFLGNTFVYSTLLS